MRFIWHNIILGIIANVLFAAPIAYMFRKRCQKKKGFFWTFLSDKNMYGNATWRPNLKNKFLRAYFWMIRNPRQNWDDTHKKKGRDYDYHGTGRMKYDKDITLFMAVVCSDTGDNHGKIIDFKASFLGENDITHKRIYEDGNIQDCFKKSKCIPFRFMWRWIMMWKWRRGHLFGLMQYSIAKPMYSYKNNKEGFEEWKKLEWKTIKI